MALQCLPTIRKSICAWVLAIEARRLLDGAKHYFLRLLFWTRKTTEQITKADRLRVSRPMQKRAKRAHESPQVTNNGKSRATLRQLSSAVLRTLKCQGIT